MKKFLLAIASVAMIVATSCNKTSVNEPETESVVVRDPKPGEFVASIYKGSMLYKMQGVSDGMTTKAHLDGNSMVWDNDDTISINHVSYLMTGIDQQTKHAIFTSTRTNPDTIISAPYYAYYGATPTGYLCGKMLEGDQIYGEEGKSVPMFAHSSEETLVFHNICGALRIIVPLSTANKIVVTADEDMNGNFTIANPANPVAVINNETSTAANKTITLVRNDGKTFQNGDTVFISVPAGTYHHLEIKFMNGDNVEWTTGQATNDYEVVVNKIHKVNMIGAFGGLLPGKFTVNDQGKQVRFTMGNLYYDPNESAKWKIDSTQDYVAFANANHRSLFAFNESFGGSAVEEGKQHSSTGSYLFCDNSHKNTAYLGNVAIEKCYLPNHEEWEYLVTKEGTHKRYSPTRLSNNPQSYILVIAPDGYTNESIPVYNNARAYTEAGFLYLSNCGFKRSNETFIVVNATNGARYWAGELFESDKRNAWILSIEAFGSKGSITEKGYKVCYDTKQNSRGIRLVQNVEGTAQATSYENGTNSQW